MRSSQPQANTVPPSPSARTATAKLTPAGSPRKRTSSSSSLRTCSRSPGSRRTKSSSQSASAKSPTTTRGSVSRSPTYSGVTCMLPKPASPTATSKDTLAASSAEARTRKAATTVPAWSAEWANPMASVVAVTVSRVESWARPSRAKRTVSPAKGAPLGSRSCTVRSAVSPPARDTVGSPTISRLRASTTAASIAPPSRSYIAFSEQPAAASTTSSAHGRHRSRPNPAKVR